MQKEAILSTKTQTQNLKRTEASLLVVRNQERFRVLCKVG